MLQGFWFNSLLLQEQKQVLTHLHISINNSLVQGGHNPQSLSLVPTQDLTGFEPNEAEEPGWGRGHREKQTPRGLQPWFLVRFCFATLNLLNSLLARAIKQPQSQTVKLITTQFLSYKVERDWIPLRHNVLNWSLVLKCYQFWLNQIMVFSPG